MGILFHISGSCAACVDQSMESTCICLDDKSCNGDDLLGEPCSCRLGIEGTLESIAKKCKDKNGVIGVLYLSGLDIDSLQPLAGALHRVEQGFILKNTMVESLEPINGLSSVGDLIIHGNRKLSHVFGLGNLTEVRSNLNIINNDRVADIDGLKKVVKVGGNLTIRKNNELSNINGLANLVRVDGSVAIESNRGLVNIDGLGSLINIIGSLRVSENEALSGIEGMGKLAKVGGNMTIDRNQRLQQIDGFRDLSEVHGDVVLSENSVLFGISGLGNLAEVDGSMIIQFNPKLLYVNDFNHLTKLTGDLFVSSNYRLLEIGGFETLRHVGGGIYFMDNFELMNITGLQNLIEIDRDLVIYGNLMLSNLSGFRNLATVGRSLKIGDTDNLIRITGFGSLTTVRSTLHVCGNLQLLDLTGLGSELNRLYGLIVDANNALQSLHGLEKLRNVDVELRISNNYNLTALNALRNNLRAVGGGLTITNNEALLSLEGLENVLNVMNGNLEISGNCKLDSLYPLKDLIEVRGDTTIKNNGRLKTLDGLENLVLVGGDLTIVGASLNIGHLQKLQKVGGNVLLSGVGYLIPDLIYGWMGSLVSVGNHLTLSKMLVAHADHFEKFKAVGGDLVVQESIFFGQDILTHVETVGGSLDIRSNHAFLTRGGLHVLSNLQSICGISKPCSLKIRGNREFGHMNGFPDLNTFNGSLSITGNKNLYSITGFQKLTSLVQKETNVDLYLKDLSGKRMMPESISGAFVIALNPDLRSIEGFKALVSIKGGVSIFENRILNRIFLQNLTSVVGMTQIRENSRDIKDLAMVEEVPYSEPGCRSRQNTIPFLKPRPGNDTAFMTNLVKYECYVEKILPTFVGLATIVVIITMSFLLLRYIFLSQNPNSVHQRPMTKRDLRNMFGVHVLALADVLSDAGFIVSTFIMWQGQCPREKDARLLAIGILSTVVLVGSQLYVAIAVYVALGRKMTGQTTPLFQSLRIGQAMRKRDWFLLFPGLLVLETEVIKHLPWDSSISLDDDVADGFPHEYFARVAFVAVLLEDPPQIVLQTIFIVLIEGSDGWAITGAIASLTLSITDVIVKLAFPLCTKGIKS